MTTHFDNLLSVCLDTVTIWYLYRESGRYWVSVGMVPFSAQFEAVVDDFGTLIPVLRRS